VQVEVLSGLADVDGGEWDALVGDESPFLESGWLAALEASGCVGERTAWLPQHLALTDGGRLIGACPLYVKGDSQGEFVFDHGWAAAAARAGIEYYPKLLVAVPFTPATGIRFLAHPDVDRLGVVRALGTAVRELCTRHGFSSAHVNFCRSDEAEVLAEIGYELRRGYQFQWHNPGWRTFDDYLAALRSKRRTQVKRERRELERQGVTIEALMGSAIPDALWDALFPLNKSTIDKLYWGHQYLNRALFDELRRRWAHRLCVIVARRDGAVIAGTINVRKDPVLYGRYWGAFEEVPFLHFNVCYYAAIDYCTRAGLERFEPGAGGEFKHLRGFDARPTTSMHYLAEPRLARAVRDYLHEERAAIDREIDFLGAQSAFKR